jgi:DNA-binding transcriptional regulator LsrR (DeoR family)
MAESELSHDKWIRCIAAASLRAEGAKEHEIQRKLNLKTPAQAANLLKIAKEKKIFESQPVFLRDAISDADYGEARDRYLLDRQRLAQLKHWVPTNLVLREVHVYSNALEEFCEQAGSRTAELLSRKQCQCVGVTLGRTLKGIIDHVHLVKGRTPVHPLDVIPICGDPVHLLNQGKTNTTSSHLAAQLQRSFTPHDRSDLPTLVGVPCFIPEQFLAKEPGKSPLEKYFHSLPGHQKIFGQDGAGLINTLDTILTGVGIISQNDEDEDVQPQTGVFLREFLEVYPNTKKSALGKLVLGELGGYMIQKEAMADKQRDFLARINRAWTGARLEHFQRVATAGAAKDGPAGIVVAARGTSKAGLIREILHRNLANILMIDDALLSAIPPGPPDADAPLAE